MADTRERDLAELADEIKALSDEDLAAIGQRWRQQAVSVMSGQPDVNVLAAEAIRAAVDFMSLRRQLTQLRPSLAARLPLPSDQELGKSIARTAEFRAMVAARTPDQDAIDAIASFAQVVCLRPWVPEALFDNAAAAFRSVRPGFLET